MAKYLELFENEAALKTTVESATDGQPWVGAETATKKVRYEKNGVVSKHPIVTGEE